MYRSVGRWQLSNLVCLSVLLTVIFSAIQLGAADKTCLAADIKCTVKDIITLNPIQGAILKLTKGDLELFGETDVNGEYTFTELASGDYIIKADAQCYDSKKKTVTLPDTTKTTFKLNPVADPTGSLSGTVKDGITDDPISGATVKIEPNGPTKQTAGDGSYTFDCVEVGTYDISADKDGYIEKTEKNVEITADPATTLDFVLVPAKIKGTVTDADTLAPIPGVLVKALVGDTVVTSKKTNAEGKYSLNLNPDTYVVRGSKDGYSTYTSGEIVLGSEGTVTHDFTLTFTGGSISGTVLDGSGDFVIGAKVTLANSEALIPDIRVDALSDNTTTTDKNGEYAFNNLELGTYDVSLSEDCYDPEEQSQQVVLTSEAPQGTANFALTENPGEGTLAGIIKDKDTKEPIEDATVRITKPASAASQTTTDDRGIFRFLQCLTADKNYTVEAEKDCYYSKVTKKVKPAVEGENKLVFNLTSITCTSTTITTIATTSTTTTTTTTSTTSTTTTSTTTTTTSSTTSTTLTPGSTTTTKTTTTTSTTTTTLCEPCAGTPASITFSNTCNSVTFVISGESGPRTENLDYKRDGKGRIINVCGTVTYANSENTYCVEINVTWGFFCISNVQGFAKRIAD